MVSINLARDGTQVMAGTVVNVENVVTGVVLALSGNDIGNVGLVLVTTGSTVTAATTC